jgi:hypothetical protein
MTNYQMSVDPKIFDLNTFYILLRYESKFRKGNILSKEILIEREKKEYFYQKFEDNNFLSFVVYKEAWKMSFLWQKLLKLKI